MRVVHAIPMAAALLLSSAMPLLAQGSRSQAAVTVPRLINVSGVFAPADGQPAASVEAVTLSIYSEQEGGTPIWQETQSVAVDSVGRYALLLGATTAAGIPPEVFATGEAQWLGIVFARPGEVEGPRVRLTSVPYALRSADADTLGGRPASAFLLAPSGADASRASAGEGAVATASESVTPAAVNPGTPNFLAKYVNSDDVGNSAVYESGGRVGIGTTAPADSMHVQFMDTGGAFTGYAVRNLGNTATSYSGMLFYDQNGALGQFQGFNNVTHEYRINNIARNAMSQFDGSINFMTGSTSRFFVRSNGNIGIGTTAPSALLEVSNAVPGGPANMYISSYTNAIGPYYLGRRARGTPGTPTAVQTGDGLAGLIGQGYGTTGFGPNFNGAITVQAAQNWTDTAQGTALTFTTTSINSTSPATRMTIAPSGNVGIGTSSPTATVEAVRDGDVAVVGATSFHNGCCAGFVGRMARGTAAAPAAVQLGDPLALFHGDGYGTTQFSSEAGGMVVLAAENWTDTAQGTVVAFTTTPLGSTEDAGRMAILPDGNVGIGTFTSMPTIADKLQVFGDIRVGTTGTNGCVKRFDGNGLIGTCVSDRRFKRDITPFGAALSSVAALQPVHYFWRAAEFPERRFGEGRTYGLIAQDVEQVLPDLVVTGADGYKAVDYSKLPLLTIQAVKELKAENDSLRATNEALQAANRELKAASDAFERRLADVERLLTELAAASARR